MAFEPSEMSRDSFILAIPVIKNRINVKAWEKNIELRVQKEIYKLGQQARDMARGLAPKKTGALRASIYVSSPGNPVEQQAGIESKRSTYNFSRAVQKAVRLNDYLELRGGKNEQYLGMERIYDEYMGVYTGEEQQVMRTSGYRFDERTQRLLGISNKVLLANPKDFLVKTSAKTFSFDNTGDEYPGRKGAVDVITINEMPKALVTDPSYLYVIVGAAVHYAGYVEYGHHYIAPSPFLRPAIEWARTQLEGRIRNVIGNEAAIPYVH